MKSFTYKGLEENHLEKPGDKATLKDGPRKVEGKKGN